MTGARARNHVAAAVRPVRDRDLRAKLQRFAQVDSLDVAAELERRERAVHLHARSFGQLLVSRRGRLRAYDGLWQTRSRVARIVQPRGCQETECKCREERNRLPMP